VLFWKVSAKGKNLINMSPRTNGLMFHTQLLEEDVRKDIKINDVISYKFTNTTEDGKPVRPIIYQLRRDLTWREVLSKLPKDPNKTGGKMTTESKWTKPERRRKFFDQLAQFKKFDPLDSEKWYSISQKDIVNFVCLLSEIFSF
jgi:hypothetical protein